MCNSFFFFFFLQRPCSCFVTASPDYSGTIIHNFFSTLLFRKQCTQSAAGIYLSANLGASIVLVPSLSFRVNCGKQTLWKTQVYDTRLLRQDNLHKYTPALCIFGAQCNRQK